MTTTAQAALYHAAECRNLVNVGAAMVRNANAMPHHATAYAIRTTATALTLIALEAHPLAIGDTFADQAI